MRNHLLLVLLLGITLVFLACSSIAVADNSTYQIYGRLTDQNGKGLAGAEITLLSNGARAMTLGSNPITSAGGTQNSGFFSFNVTGVGEYQIAARVTDSAGITRDTRSAAFVVTGNQKAVPVNLVIDLPATPTPNATVQQTPVPSSAPTPTQPPTPVPTLPPTPAATAGPIAASVVPTATVVPTMPAASPTSFPSPAVIPSPTAPPPTTVSSAINEEIQKLTPGYIVYNPQGEMTVGKEERVEVRISRDYTEQLKEGFKGRGEPVVNNTTVGTFMTVRLTGDNFKITSLSHEEQVIPASEPAQWDFDVMPTKSGDQSLQLAVSVRIKSPDGTTVYRDLPVFDRQIVVNVNPLYSIGSFIETNWQWILGGSGIGLVTLILATLSNLIKPGEVVKKIKKHFYSQRKHHKTRR